VADKLQDMNIRASADRVITSSDAAVHYIKRIESNPKVYMIGEEGLRVALNVNDVPITNQKDANSVLIGLDRHITYEKLATAALAVQNGALLISTNQDAAIPSEHGFVPGNGSLTSVLSVSTGIDPIFIGKPETIMLENALEQLNAAKEDVIFVGDNYNTDITAGIRAKIDTLMVFTGVTRPEDLSNVNRQPTYRVNNLREWIKLRD